MQKRLIAFLLFTLFEGIICYCARAADPFTLALEQWLSDVTIEIVPCPTYPNACPPYQKVPPCPSKPCVVEPNCGYYPEPYCCPIEFEMTLPPCPTCLDFCGMDSYPPCNCYRDMKNPCIVCDNPAPLCICFECDHPVPPYLYFPEVEYPMGAMDIKPYYYGNCWCT